MTRIIITLALLALGCSSVQAEDRYSGVTLMRGTVVLSLIHISEPTRQP